MVFIRTDREDRTYIHPTYTLPMAAVLCPLPLRESTRMAAHNRLMEREWGFGCLIFILAEKSWDAQWWASCVICSAGAWDESVTMSMRQVLATQWVPGQLVLQNETMVHQNKNKKKYLGSALVAQKNVLFLQETAGAGRFFFWWDEIIWLFHEPRGNYYSLVRS